MLRYHKQVYFKSEDKEKLKAFTNRLNGLNWAYSKHCLDSIKDRALDIESLLLFIKDTYLDFKNIFEYYADDLRGDILKACYRIKWLDDLDVILCLSDEKNIISIWLNSKNDLHFSLRKEAYING